MAVGDKRLVIARGYCAQKRGYRLRHLVVLWGIEELASVPKEWGVNCVKVPLWL